MASFSLTNHLAQRLDLVTENLLNLANIVKVTGIAKSMILLYNKDDDFKEKPMRGMLLIRLHGQKLWQLFKSGLFIVMAIFSVA